MGEEGRRRIAGLADHFRPMVTELEARGATAADYVRAINDLARSLDEEPAPGFYLALGMALELAGANALMVREALRVLGKVPRPRDEETKIRACPPDREEREV